MANVLVEETSLQNIANSIREKTGTEDTYKPSEMATAISNIESGGGSGSNAYDGIIDRTITEITNNSVASIGKYAFSKCTNLTNVTFTETTIVDEEAFEGCTGLITINFPKATHFRYSSFKGCKALTNINAPELTYLNVNVFYGCTSLTSVDLPKVNSIGNGCFQSCTSLTKVILRANEVCYISRGAGASIFNNTPIKNGTGYVYVPDDLVESYKADTNWSEIADQIKPISELQTE